MSRVSVVIASSSSAGVRRRSSARSVIQIPARVTAPGIRFRIHASYSTHHRKQRPLGVRISISSSRMTNISTLSLRRVRRAGSSKRPLSFPIVLRKKANPVMEAPDCVVCHKTLNPEGTSGDEYVSKPPADIGDGFWLKKGTFKSAPIGHASCMTCHAQDSGLARSLRLHAPGS